MNNVNTGLGWLDKALSIVEKYRLSVIFKGIFIIVLISLVVGFINNPAVIFETWKRWEDERHTEHIEMRLKNNEKIHILAEKLMYRVDADRVMILETHNGGTNLANLPFLKCSCVYEAMGDGVVPVSDQYQQVQLSLLPFSSYLFSHGYWCGDVDDLQAIDKNLYYKMKSNGTEHFAACVIEGVDTPLAFLVVSFDDIPSEHDCQKVRENIRHVSLELALLLELNK